MMAMNNDALPRLTVVVPVHNEAAGIALFHERLVATLVTLGLPYDIIYCDDGSRDGSAAIIAPWCDKHSTVKLVRLTRNFGKEMALTAGLQQARGDAILMLDADGQHPINMIPKFVAAWQNGAKVVVGRQAAYHRGNWLKHAGSRLFYGGLCRILGVSIDLQTTDFRLIDRSVRDEFVLLGEHNRITRGLIDWLGYPAVYLPVTIAPRLAGEASYSLVKLTKLALDSALSLSISPLYAAAIAGLIVLPLSILLALVMVADAVLRDPLHWHVTGSAYVVVFMLFLIGVLLVSQGIIGLYLSRIHIESQRRPLFVIDKEGSRGISHE